MSYLRKSDDYMHKMAHNQAWIFEKSSFDKLPSFSFIKMYMCSEKVEKLDKLVLVSDEEIYIPIKTKIKRKGTIVSSSVMHWIGYIYRCISYLYDVSSRVLYKKVTPKYLISIYPLWHSQDPAKVALNIYEEKIDDHTSDMERALKLMKKIY